jgi:DNA-binding NtrC family response regulator
MPEISGQEVLKILEEEQPQIPVIVITGYNDLDTAIETMKLGAYDYLVKPIDIERVSVALKNALKYVDLNKSLKILRKQFFIEELDSPEAFSHIVTADPIMIKTFHYLSAIADSSQPVLITGETGVGKELFAKALHDLSNRKGSFVAMDVSSYDSTMFSDTLFGHIKGAYTGADITRDGLIKAADGGTLFLDEIGDLSLELQSILMRVIQEHEFRQNGSDKLSRTNARIIFATNKDLMKMIDEGKFRKDLYYRLETHHIQIPPLRKRKDDLPLLVDHFIEKAAMEVNKKVTDVPKELFQYLKQHDFPGNIRELQNLLFNAVALATDGRLSLETILEKLKINKVDSSITSGSFQIAFEDGFPTFQQMEEKLVDEALRICENKQSDAAILLGISRQALNKRLNKNKN